MVTIAEQLEQLQKDKEKLVKKLKGKGVDVSDDETFTSLVPKVDVHTITFIDYDGTILYELDLDEMTELPALPEHEGLICQGWNWTLEELKEENASLYVGPQYITDDEKTRVYITLTEDDLDLWVSFKQPYNKTMYVDFGDNSEEYTSDVGGFVSINHIYPSAGDYVISFYCDDSNTNEYEFCGYNSKPGVLLCRRQVPASNDNTIKDSETLMPSINKVEMGARASLHVSAFSYATNMKTINTPSYLGVWGSFYNTTSLKTYIQSRASVNIGQNVFTKSGLETFVSTKKFTGYKYGVSNDTMTFGPNLKNCYLPKSASVVPNFSNTKRLITVLPGAITELHDTKIEDTFDSVPETCTSFIGTAMTGYKGFTFTFPEQTYGIWGNIFGNNRFIEEVVYPEEPVIISNYMSFQNTFSGCSSIKRIVFPKTKITSFGSTICRNCTNLKEVILPSTLEELGGNDFNGCTALEEIDLPNTLITIGSSCFDGCKVLRNINLPDTLTTIANYAFRNCAINPTIPSSVTEIGGYAFYGCTNLTGPLDLSNLTNHSGYSFSGCTSLTQLTLSKIATAIGQGSFYNCKSLSYVYIPSNIVTLNTTCFALQSSTDAPSQVFDFRDHTTIPSVTTSSFTKHTNLKIIVPDDLYDTWITTGNWTGYKSYIIKASEYVEE